MSAEAERLADAVEAVLYLAEDTPGENRRELEAAWLAYCGSVDDRPVKRSRKHHKAEPEDPMTAGFSACVHCGLEVQRVPGGNGPTWVHSLTGAVAGTGGPS